MISDEERRAFAENLRYIAQHPPEWATSACAIAEVFDADYPLWKDSGELFDMLADLIDVPTTTLDFTEATRTVHGEEVRGWECRECGQSCEEMYGEYEYCPHCRRKVDRCEGMDMEKEKKKAMVSQPMRGKTDEEILEARNRVAAKLQAAGYEVADTVFHFTDEQMNRAGVKNRAIYYLSNSIQAMSRCDCVYFAKGWENARGCRIEHFIAAAYGMEIMYERW